MKLKDDKRPARYMWAPGGYYCSCRECGAQYAGDKRSNLCADCAYALPDPPPIKALNDKFPVVLYFENDTDREEFIQVVQQAKPGMRTVKL